MRSLTGAMRQRHSGVCLCGILLTMIDQVTGAVMGDRQLSDAHLSQPNLARAVL